MAKRTKNKARIFGMCTFFLFFFQINEQTNIISVRCVICWKKVWGDQCLVASNQKVCLSPGLGYRVTDTILVPTCVTRTLVLLRNGCVIKLLSSCTALYVWLISVLWVPHFATGLMLSIARKIHKYQNRAFLRLSLTLYCRLYPPSLPGPHMPSVPCQTRASIVPGDRACRAT